MTVIAMTREIGSLGTVVAERLAARLGLKIIHSEVVADSVAERLGVEAGAVLRYVNGSATLLERWQIDRRRLFHYAAEEVLRLAQQGNVLIKGWGAATLLRDMPHVISVRVCAPMDFRVRVVMDRLGAKDANVVREQIGRYEAARARAKIGSAFVEHISFSAAPLGVSVSVADGKVTLAGTTSSGSVRKRAEKIAHDVAGACHIDNRIVSVPSRGSAF